MHIIGSRGKSTREHKVAWEFLEWITNEKALLMGMLADYYTECVELLRYQETKKDPNLIDQQSSKTLGIAENGCAWRMQLASFWPTMLSSTHFGQYL